MIFLAEALSTPPKFGNVKRNLQISNSFLGFPILGVLREPPQKNHVLYKKLAEKSIVKVEHFVMIPYLIFWMLQAAKHLCFEP